MKQVLVRHFGDPRAVCESVPQVREDLPTGRVRVQMIARPINPSDLIPITGAYRSRLSPPFVPGFEGVGRITEIGAGLAGFAVGDRVLPLGRNGTWASEVIADPDWCIPVPDDFDDDVAAQLYINPATAWWIMTRDLNLKPGDGIAVNACGSAISRLFLALAKARDIRFTALVRGEERRAEWQKLGAETIIDRDREDIGAALGPVVAQHGLKAGIDAIGGADGLAMAMSLPAGARFIHYGLLSGQTLPGDLQERVAEGVEIRLFWLRNIMHAMDTADRLALFADLFAFLRAHPVDLPVEGRYGLSEIAAALAHNARNRRAGKILLTG